MCYKIKKDKVLNQNDLPKEWGFEDYINFIIRRRWTIISVFVIIFGGVLYHNLSRPLEYNSVSTFFIENQSVDFGEIRPEFSTQTRPIGFYQALINSKIYKARVIEFIKQDSILQELEYNKVETYNELIKNGLFLSNSEFTDLLNISVKAYDPVVAYGVAQIATQVFKNRSQEIEQEEARNIIDFVSNQIKIASKNLEVSERQLQEFQKKTKINVTKDDGGIIKRLGDLETKLTEIETERQLTQANLETYEIRLGQFKDFTAEKLLDTESPTLKILKRDIDELENKKNILLENNSTASSQISNLEDLISLKKSNLVQAIIDSNTNGKAENSIPADQSLKEVLIQKQINEELDLYVLTNREKFYQGLIKRYRQNNPNLLEHSLELARLQRSKKVYENLYNFLVERGEEAKINAATGTGGIRIVDSPSIPTEPIPPKTAKFMIFGFILGLGLGVGCGFVADFIDSTMQSPAEVEEKTGLTVIGNIPLLNKAEQHLVQVNKSVLHRFFPFTSKNGHAKSSYPLLSSLKAKDPAVDSYSTLRTNLQFIKIDEPLKKLLVTSSIPGEGKTVTSSNLAISFAELYKRVLLVDTDLRKPMVHNLFKMEKSPGLTNHLAGAKSLEEIIRKTDNPNLDIITAGTSPPNPAEIIASQKLTNMIKKVEQSYDMIIFDSPPLLLVTDTILLASIVKNVLVITRFAKTNHRFVTDALKRLANINTKVFGVVLNGIHFPKLYGYQKYNYFYNYQYYSDKPQKKTRTRSKITEKTIV
jgi:capsular exopolysaccharide synthesis family protein